MAVANTYTLQESFGSRIVVRGAGFLLNNEMTDFNARPGHTDRHGAIGTDANVVAPGKRMLSSQSPTIVARDGRLQVITGSPGGRTIPNTVLCVLVNILDFDRDVRAAVDAPRMHHPWLPDRVTVELADDAANAPLVRNLRELGHSVVSRQRNQGDAHTIRVVDDVLDGAADTRNTIGKAAGHHITPLSTLRRTTTQRLTTFGRRPASFAVIETLDLGGRKRLAERRHSGFPLRFADDRQPLDIVEMLGIELHIFPQGEPSFPAVEIVQFEQNAELAMGLDQTLDFGQKPFVILLAELAAGTHHEILTGSFLAHFNSHGIHLKSWFTGPARAIIPRNVSAAYHIPRRA